MASVHLCEAEVTPREIPERRQLCPARKPVLPVAVGLRPVARKENTEAEELAVRDCREEFLRGLGESRRRSAVFVPGVLVDSAEENFNGLGDIPSHFNRSWVSVRMAAVFRMSVEILGPSSGLPYISQ